MSEPEPMQERPKKHAHLWRCRCLHGAHKRRKESLSSRQCPLSLSLSRARARARLLLLQQLPPSLCPFLCLLVPAQAQAPLVVPTAPVCRCRRRGPETGIRPRPSGPRVGEPEHGAPGGGGGGRGQPAAGRVWIKPSTVIQNPFKLLWDKSNFGLRRTYQ
jgi:hypothetical protein